MSENTFTLRSLGIGCEGIKDQYADGEAAKVYEVFVGDNKSRTQIYKNFVFSLLKQKGCKRILDAACGTGVDSLMLLEEGFEVVSVDASDKMLKHALKARWERRKEEAFDKWIIRESNWLTLYDDLEDLVGDGFDAVICLGNSFPHILDNYGDQREHKQAFRNFEKCIKPGGLLLIDHRNYDNVIKTGKTSVHSIYYNSEHTKDITTSVIYVSGEPTMVVRDYQVEYTTKDNQKAVSHFRLSFYPHRYEVFHKLLKETFGEKSNCKVYGDFKPLHEIEVPDYYIHVVEKSSN